MLLLLDWGLTCGATLAKNGKNVLVLEQHNLIGGCATYSSRKGILVDTGLHELDFGTPDANQKHLVFSEIGLWDKVKFVPLPTAWTITDGKEEYVIPHHNTAQALKEMFPHEAKEIDIYFKMIELQAKKLQASLL